MLARCANAFINVGFTQDARESGYASTHKTIDEIVTYTVVLTGYACTLIYISVATRATETCGAGTCITVKCVHTNSTVLTWITRAFIDVRFANGARKPGSANTVKSISIVDT
jgi:hypothetical protein